MKRAREEDTLPAAKAPRYDEAGGAATAASPLDVSELVAQEIVTWVGPASQHAMRYVCKLWHAWIPPPVSLAAIVRDVLKQGYAALFLAWPAFFSATQLRFVDSAALWASAIRENRVDWIALIGNGRQCVQERRGFTSSALSPFMILSHALFEVSVPSALAAIHAMRIVLTRANTDLDASSLLQWVVQRRGMRRENDGLVDALIEELRVSGHYRSTMTDLLFAIKAALVVEHTEGYDTELAWRLFELIGRTWVTQGDVRGITRWLLCHFGPIEPLKHIWEDQLATARYEEMILHHISDFRGKQCELVPLYDWNIQWLPASIDTTALLKRGERGTLETFLLITRPDQLDRFVLDPPPTHDYPTPGVWMSVALHAYNVSRDTWRALFRLAPSWCQHRGSSMQLPAPPWPHDRVTTLNNFLATVPFERLAPSVMVLLAGRPLRRPRTHSPRTQGAIDAAKQYFPTHLAVLEQFIELARQLDNETAPDSPCPITKRLLAMTDADDAEKWALVVETL